MSNLPDAPDGFEPKSEAERQAEIDSIIARWKAPQPEPTEPTKAQRDAEALLAKTHPNQPVADQLGIPVELVNSVLNQTDMDELDKAYQLARLQFPVADLYADSANKAAERRMQDPTELKLQTSVEYVREKARGEAKRLVASENYTGSEKMDWDDLEVSAQSYIVDDLIPHDAYVYLVAKRNLGKTMAYIDMLCSQALGMPWLGKVTVPTKVTVILGEGVNGFIDRIKAWCDVHGQDLETLKPWFTFIRGANLMNDESLARIKAVADQHEAGLLVFDTWATVSGAMSEDDAAMNSEVLRRVGTIRPGATNLFIHHPRKSDQDTDHPVMRGSGSMDGRADVVLTMFYDRKFNAKSGQSHEWLAISTENDHGGKNRTAMTETIRGLYIEEHGESAVFRQVDEQAISKESREVSKYLKGRMTIEAYTAAAGVSPSTARRHLNASVAEGITQVEQTQARGVSAVYWLTDQSVPKTDYPRLVREQLNLAN